MKTNKGSVVDRSYVACFNGITYLGKILSAGDDSSELVAIYSVQRK